jgi:SHS2 domain-containing protein
VIEHTADVGIRAYGSSMAEVFENCSRGMMTLMLDIDSVRLDQRVEIAAHGMDRQSLLVSWLSEILFQVEVGGWAFGAFEVGEATDLEARGWGLGESLDPVMHKVAREIKAPTYHGLELEEREGRWTAQVIFDV